MNLCARKKRRIALCNAVEVDQQTCRDGATEHIPSELLPLRCREQLKEQPCDLRTHHAAEADCPVPSPEKAGGKITPLTGKLLHKRTAEPEDDAFVCLRSVDEQWTVQLVWADEQQIAGLFGKRNALDLIGELAGEQQRAFVEVVEMQRDLNAVIPREMKHLKVFTQHMLAKLQFCQKLLQCVITS
ncbi:hypothetical protein SDC9_149512 [bioreactor metagenome]|uniref:Uncharacterized protein n=1 Tax=bioreactor metagenome TaxID=1076179 RepID=A0A645EJW0_9ZZZZ